MAAIVARSDVDRPVDAVFAYVTDPSRFHEWQQGVVTARMDGTDGPRIGDRCVTTRRIGLANRKVTSALVAFEPPHRWGVRGIDGPIRAVVDVTVEPRADGAAHVAIAVDFEGHGIGRVLVPLVVRRQARREMPGNLAALKRQLETGG